MTTANAVPPTAHVQPQRHRPPSGVLIVTMVLYTGFAIPVSIVAMAHAFPIGVLLAAFLAWQWGRLPALIAGNPPAVTFAALTPQVPTEAPASQGATSTGKMTSGNASFDAYREDLLTRLEKEQSDFEGFVARLRAAKDKTEFDTYMDAREQRARRGPDDAAPKPA